MDPLHMDVAPKLSIEAIEETKSVDPLHMDVAPKLSIEAIMVTKFVDLSHILASDPEPT